MSLDERNHAARWLTYGEGITRVPEHEVGPFLPVSDDDVSTFNDILGDDIDSAFGSSICCCDRCYDDFRSHWPDVAFRTAEFQEQSMDAALLVDNSRLPGIYSPIEISTLRHFVQCLRCDEYAYRVWIYEHTIDNPDEIEQAIDELSKIGSRTPFLIMEHSFARRVLDAIRRIAASTNAIEIKSSLFRARSVKDVTSCGQSVTDIATYAAPPAPNVAEGRFNHAGSPMLYLASTVQVAAAEIGQPGEACYVGELVFSEALRILDLVEVDEESADYELFKALASSALLAAPRTERGWLRRQYVFSRFVADCARSAGFDAIRYGSTKQVHGYNYVILDPPADISTIATLSRTHESEGIAPSTRY